LDISLIVAVAQTGVIGRGGGLPWRLSNDLRYFKSVTMGKPIIMGRKTFESIGRPLPGRPNIVVSRNPDFTVEGIDVRPGLAAAFSHAMTLSGDEAMIIGGAALYADALANAGRIYLTEVHADVEGDVRFPEIHPSDWVEIRREKHPESEKDDFAHSFVVLERNTTA